MRTKTKANPMSLTVVAGLLSFAGCSTVGMSQARESQTVASAASSASQQCAGISKKEQHLGLLAYREAITGTQPLIEKRQMGKSAVPYDRGAVLMVRAEPGLSAPWLERVASCHRALALEEGVAGMSEVSVDPLLVPGSSVWVEEVATGYKVSIRNPDRESAADVMQRAQAMLSPASRALAKASPTN